MSYDRRMAALSRGNWDPSILGYTHADVEAMDDEELEEALQECLNRAANILENSVSAFYGQLEKSSRSELNSYADKIIALVRKR